MGDRSHYLDGCCKGCSGLNSTQDRGIECLEISNEIINAIKKIPEGAVVWSSGERARLFSDDSSLNRAEVYNFSVFFCFLKNSRRRKAEEIFLAAHTF